MNLVIHTDSFRYLWEVMENEEYSFLFNKLRVVDLGCNIGAFSLWIYPHADRIWAIDSEQKYLDKFNETIRENELTGITLLKERVLDLREFMQGHSITNIDLLKIDIEGDEYEIFSKNDFPKIPTIIGEYHREETLESSLVRLGYRYFEIPNKHFLARL